MSTAFSAYVMAVERVERSLRQVTAALDASGIRYAVVGGNAVAAWVASVDPGGTRTTKDVDLLVDRSDVEQIGAVLQSLGFRREDLRDMVLFVDPAEPSRRAAVHLDWAGERVRPSHPVAAPSLSEVVRDPQGFLVIELTALVRMKLAAFRDIDRVHLQDLHSVGLVTPALRAQLPDELRRRLDEVLANESDEIAER